MSSASKTARVLALAFAVVQSASLAAEDPRGVATEADVAQLKTSQLECLVGNNKSINTEFGKHRPGYNGIFWLRSKDQPESPFVPSYAGWNLEHYFDGRADYGDEFFAPRLAQMDLRRLSDGSVELYQPRTAAFAVESWTRLSAAEPYYVDFEFRFVIHEDDFQSDFMGVFWASYINGPMDKSIYFIDAESTLDQPVWRQLCTQQHNRDSSVRSKDDHEKLMFERPNSTLFASVSPLRYAEPFFYGRFRNMVLIYVFEPDPRLRLTHSPSGGGANQQGDDTNPAWDFQFVVPRFQVGKEYRLTGRLVYKPWKGRGDVIAEVRKFRKGSE